MSKVENTADFTFAAFPWEAGQRAIILVDLDAFFASVEQLDHPEWRGRPVIVGGPPEMRGVVSTASYEARAFGVRSAMPSANAKRLCPDAIWTQGNFRRYGEVSAHIMQIIRSYTPFVQQVSIDEAFADITPTKAFPAHPADVAARIQADVAALGVTCSIGLATCKSLAKIASEQDKPRGLTVVYPGREAAFVRDLPLSALSGIGAATEERLHRAGFFTLGEVYSTPVDALERLLGKVGRTIHDRLHGNEDVDYTPAAPKSVSHDVTFAKDLTTPAEVEREVLFVLAEVCRRLRKTGLFATVLAVKLHYDACNGKSAQSHLARPSYDEYELRDTCKALLAKLLIPGVPVRLVSVRLSGLVADAAIQEQLLAVEGEANSRDTAALLRAEDKINERFGRGAVYTGRSCLSHTAHYPQDDRTH